MIKRVLIIENQFLQYELLVKGLKNDEYVISPLSRDEYESLIAAVKVYLNEDGYPSNYRDACFDVIKRYCSPAKDSNVDLIIMDYKLGGSTVCKTGYDLAFDIWNKIDKNILVLFLSRTDYAEKHSYEQRLEMGDSNYHFDWLMKGFLGEETMQALFVDKVVRKKVEEMFKKDWPIVSGPNKEYIDLIDTLLLKPVIEDEDRDNFKEMRTHIMALDRKIDENNPFVLELRKRVNDNRATTRGDLKKHFEALCK